MTSDDRGGIQPASDDAADGDIFCETVRAQGDRARLRLSEMFERELADIEADDASTPVSADRGFWETVRAQGDRARLSGMFELLRFTVVSIRQMNSGAEKVHYLAIAAALFVGPLLTSVMSGFAVSSVLHVGAVATALLAAMAFLAAFFVEYGIVSEPLPRRHGARVRVGLRLLYLVFLFLPGANIVTEWCLNSLVSGEADWVRVLTHVVLMMQLMLLQACPLLLKFSRRPRHDADIAADAEIADSRDVLVRWDEVEAARSRRVWMKRGHLADQLAELRTGALFEKARAEAEQAKLSAQAEHLRARVEVIRRLDQFKDELERDLDLREVPADEDIHSAEEP
ncbi:MAG TPA: hypothetical protein VM347_25275 [Nonomuraea sp.]|nr:hypothetical protein [Nonomuraea sp.]